MFFARRALTLLTLGAPLASGFRLPFSHASALSTSHALSISTRSFPVSRLAVRQPRVSLCTEAPAAAPPPPPPPPEEQSDFSKLDIRVGQIVEAWEHPDSDKLWCEKIDVGEEEPREIASGLRAYYSSKEDMEGQRVLVVCNLKSAKLGGFPSAGMVLCASSADGDAVEFVVPPEESPVGERVTCATLPGGDPWSPNKVQKKKVMAAVADELRTSADRVVTFKGEAISTAAGAVTAPTIAGGNVN